MEDREYEHVILEVDGQKVWIRRAIDQEEKAEILTDDAGVIECLTALAGENPDVITVLTEEGEEHFHCVAGKELAVHFVPCSGSLEFWIEKLADHIDAE